MARTIPAQRFNDLVKTSCATFISRGYRLTQMADIAREMGVAKGTLYGYVEGKRALFYLALEYADRPLEDGFPFQPPLANPEPGALLALFQRRLMEVAQFPILEQAIAQDQPEDLDAEFTAIVRELYRLLYVNRTGVKLVNRCAPEIPEIGDLWHRSGRGTEISRLRTYLQRRADGGGLASFPSGDVAARLLLETVATWAVHLNWDPVPIKYDPRVVEETVVLSLRRSFLCREL